MCLLTYLPEDTQPDLDALRKGARGNPDGHGFAIVIPEYGQHGRILVRKNMKAEPLIKEFARLREMYPYGPALFHSRITTDGVTDLFNCHPFMLNKDRRTVIGHNGIFPSSVRPSKEDARSDTRIVAEVAAKRFQLHTYLGREMFGEWMGTYNKVAILTVDPDYDQYGYIINEQSGEWHQGIWYSNGSFRGYRANSTTLGYATATNWREWEWCGREECTAKVTTVSPYTLRCTKCKHCSICFSDPCGCVLVESKKGQGSQLALAGGDAVTVVGSAKSPTTAHDAEGWLDRYREDVKALGFLASDNGCEVDPEDDLIPATPTRAQLEEVLALVDHMNNGGDLDTYSDRAEVEFPPDSIAEIDAAIDGLRDDTKYAIN